MNESIAYYSLTMCGAFFTKEYINMLKIANGISKEEDDVEFIKDLFEVIDFTQHSSYLKDIVVIDSSDILYDEALDDAGYYIGIPLYDVPEHLSIKRINIEVRSVLIAANVITNDVDSEAIRLFSKVLKSEVVE